MAKYMHMGDVDGKRQSNLTGVLIGLLADAVKLGTNYLAFLLGFTEGLLQIAASNILPEQYLGTASAIVIEPWRT